MSKKRIKDKSAYTRERDRIYRYIKSQQKKGKIVETEIPKTKKQLETELREKGYKGRELTSEINKRVRELKKLTNKQLKKVTLDYHPETVVIIPDEQLGMTILDYETGEVSHPDVYSSDFNSKFWSDAIINGFIASFMSYNQVARTLIQNWIENLRRTRDDSDIASMIEEGRKNVEFKPRYAYSLDDLSDYIRDMLSYLPDIGELEKQEMLESVMEESWNSLDM